MLLLIFFRVSFTCCIQKILYMVKIKINVFYTIKKYNETSKVDFSLYFFYPMHNASTMRPPKIVPIPFMISSKFLQFPKMFATPPNNKKTPKMPTNIVNISFLLFSNKLFSCYISILTCQKVFCKSYVNLFS